MSALFRHCARGVFTVAVCALAARGAAAQSTPRTEQFASLRVTVADQTGAVLVGARAVVTPSERGLTGAAREANTGTRGEATFEGLDPGRYTIRVEAPGFEPWEARDVRLRKGDQKRDVTLAIARLASRVDVGRDPRERASDPRSAAFAAILGEAEIQELPDDPDEMEQALRDMAGPGAVMRVNGFRGGKLPPKNQIAQIRFRRSLFAADSHEPGFMSVDIITKPGFDNWKASTGFGLRGDALNARNAFAPVKGDERLDRFSFSANGPLQKQKTSFAFNVDGTNAYDTKTIVAALPGGTFADSVRKPNNLFNVSARLEHQATAAQILRVELQRNHLFNGNLGVGDFDLAERAYSNTRNEVVARLSLAGSMRKALYNEFRFQFRSEEQSRDPFSLAPAVQVLNAFTLGGAQVAGTRSVDDIELADNLDIATGKHAIRLGVLLEGGRYATDERRNTTGTFTFASLADYAAGRPTTFSVNVGNPAVSVGHAQLGLYAQDDIRVRQDLMVSIGLRQEWQSHTGGLNLGPRGGLTWSPGKNGKTTVRGGAGVFFDWLDAQTYESAIQLDGTHQQISTTQSPGYPNAASGGSSVLLPAGRVQFASGLEQPRLFESSLSIERQLPFDIRFTGTYIHRSGFNRLRGTNINAPQASGLRPDPSAGTVTEIASTGTSTFDALSLNLNFTKPERKIFLAANYMLSRSIDDADSPFSTAADARNLAAERGPSLADARHRAMGMFNMPLGGAFRLGVAGRFQSALPYNITTGRDDNGDTISNDRPAGVTRNTGRGSATIDLSTRVSWSKGFGTRAGGGPQGPQVRIIRGNDADPLAGMPSGGPTDKRVVVEFYGQAYNVFNRDNLQNYVGVQTSPFFGQATAAAPPRRIELGARFSF